MSDIVRRFKHLEQTSLQFKVENQCGQSIRHISKIHAIYYKKSGRKRRSDEEAGGVRRCYLLSSAATFHVPRHLINGGYRVLNLEMFSR